MSNFDDQPAAEGAEKRQPRQSRLVKAALDCERFGRFDVTAQLEMPDGIRHGTAFRVPAADAERLLAHDRR